MSSPLATLLIVHVVLTVHVVEVDAHLRPVRITLPAEILLLLLLRRQVEVKPELLDLDAQIVHVLLQLLHCDISFDHLSHHLRIDDLDVDAIIVVVNVKLHSLVIHRILVWLCRRLSKINCLPLTLNILLQGNLYQRFGHDFG